MVQSMKNFWQKLPKPFFALAPLEDVTDAAFRRLIARYGKPGVMFTEFTSADGLVLAPESGKAKLLKKLLYSAEERPIVAQLFSANPVHMEAAARMVRELGFDGVDINMGCPDRAIEKGLCGSGMIKHPELAKEIIRAAKRGAGDIPVSVKTRIGYAENEIPTWVPALLEEGIAALTIHARTRNEMSDVPARWEHVKEAVAIRDAMGADTVIIGNGDLKDIADARAKVAASGADGAMLGRAIFGNPWLFSNSRELENSSVPSPRERIEALIEHIKLFDELLGGTVNFATMKKHFKAYVSGWDGAKELRVHLMDTTTAQEALAVLTSVV
jgi:nifR3 family TIM-barrel protein